MRHLKRGGGERRRWQGKAGGVHLGRAERNVVRDLRKRRAEEPAVEGGVRIHHLPTQVSTQQLGDGHPRTLKAKMNLAILLEGQGDATGAKRRRRGS